MQTANLDNGLYTQQFGLFIQFLQDEIIYKHPQFRIVLALLFSSSPSCLVNLPRRVLRCQPDALATRDFFEFIRIGPPLAWDVVDPQSLEAIRCMPQRLLPYGADLAFALKHVLQCLINLSQQPPQFWRSRHEQWLQQRKLFKHRCPARTSRLSSAFILDYPSKQRPTLVAFDMKARRRIHQDLKHVWSRNPKNVRHPFLYIFKEVRVDCRGLLRSVIHYLPKCDFTSELASLARRSLPKAALWFPKLMKGARREIDAYVLRCEGARAFFILIVPFLGFANNWCHF